MRDDTAFEMDCRQRFHTDIAYRMERPAAKYSDFYAAAHTMPGLNGETDTLILLVGKEEGQWRIMSWHLEHPFHPGDKLRTAAPPQPEKKAPLATADPTLASAVESFLFSWLVRGDFRAAMQWFAQESFACGPEAGAEHGDEKSVEHWLKEVGHQSGKGKTVSEHIAPVESHHRDVRPLKQAPSPNYLLAAVSDQLVTMHSCGDAAVEQSSSNAEARFTKRAHLTAFTFGSAKGHGGVLNFLWAPRDGGWKIVAFYISS